MPHRIGSVHGRSVDISDSTFRPLRSVPSIKALALYGLVDGREDFAIEPMQCFALGSQLISPRRHFGLAAWRVHFPLKPENDPLIPLTSSDFRTKQMIVFHGAEFSGIV